ncbi:MAG: flagellar biosynthesis protein FlhB [Bdellovibrionaceae bacterium]|nr:flagellar biosynthesis protein FlhB [Pseudobdellovibrionaceae bacterium]
MADTEQERTEEATQQRRDDFRNRGQVAQTRELATVFILLGSALLMWMMGRFFLEQVTGVLTASLGPFVVEAARGGDYVPAVLFAAKSGLFILAPMLGMAAILGVASTVLQTGLLNNEEAFEFKWEKVNPIEGFKRMFTVRSLLEGVKAVAKVVMISAVMAMVVKDQVLSVPALVQFSVHQLFAFLGDLTIRMLGSIGVFMAVLAAADYFMQWWELEKQMRMTKQEIKEEHKSREGDPLIKARIRRVQREMANKRMMNDVPKADVIVTNPTHIAVALRYDPATMAAPQVIAKGAGLIAEKIKSLARENNIPIMENKPLARTIYKTIKVGQAIPRELFTAVAQVLSYVYRLKRKVFR